MKKLIYSCLALAALIVFFGLYVIPNNIENKPKYHSSVSRAFAATCRVGGQRGYCTGVLLETGYILTASHCIDINQDGKLQESEKNVEIKMNDGIDTTGVVVYMHRINLADFAVIEPNVKMSSDIKLVDEAPEIGENSFVVGYPNKGEIHITTGKISQKNDSRYGRTSAAVFFGNSGGGVWNENQEIVGIVNRLALYPMGTSTIININGQGHFLMVPYYIQVPGWSDYCEANTIKNILKRHNLLHLVVKQNKKLDINWDYVVLTLQVLGVLTCVVWFRKNIFC